MATSWKHSENKMDPAENTTVPLVLNLQNESVSWNGLLSGVAWSQCDRRCFRYFMLSGALFFPTYSDHPLVLFLLLVIMCTAITCLLHWETLSDSFLPASTQALSLPSLPGSAPCRLWDELLADQGNTVFLLEGNLKAPHLALFLAFHFSLCFMCI